MFETTLATQSLLVGYILGGSLLSAGAVFFLYRDTRPKAPARTVEEIVRDAPYEGLANIVKIAKP